MIFPKSQPLKVYQKKRKIKGERSGFSFHQERDSKIGGAIGLTVNYYFQVITAGGHIFSIKKTCVIYNLTKITNV